MRSIYLFGSVNQDLFDDLLRQTEDLTEPFNINFASGGGSVDICIRMYEYIRSRFSNLTITAMGEIESAAVIVYLSASKRLVTNSSKFMIHAPMLTFNRDVNLAEIEVNQLSLAIDVKRYGDILRDRTKLSQKGVDIVELLSGKVPLMYLTAEGAINMGIAHNFATVSAN